MTTPLNQSERRTTENQHIERSRPKGGYGWLGVVLLAALLMPSPVTAAAAKKGKFAVVGKGQGNTALGNYATVAGGQTNIASGSYATIGGGGFNAATTDFATVGGGRSNIATGVSATIGGGERNIASGGDATVAGGTFNNATASDATVGGGGSNIADGSGATVPGGVANHASGAHSMAAGQGANATLDGTFVWNSYVNPAHAFGPNTFHVHGYNGLDVEYFDQRLDGGGSRWVYLGPAIADQTIATWTGAYLSNAGVWQNNSDRNRKTDFVPSHPREVLEKLADLPVSTWHYKNETAEVRHLGPTAQDFRAAFGLGSDEKTIGTVDEEGVALVAIQGLNQKLESQMKEKDARIIALERRLTDLEAKLQKVSE